MKEIKYRVWMDGRFAYWGFVKDAAGNLMFAGLMQSNACPLTMEEQRERSEQFTGLTDRNGKEIWEGDIISRVISQGTIINNYRVEIPNIYYIMESGFEPECAIIIGNIHENPELMEVK